MGKIYDNVSRGSMHLLSGRTIFHIVHYSQVATNEEKRRTPVCHEAHKELLERGNMTLLRINCL